MKHSFGAKGEHTACGNGGRGPRALVEAEIIAVARRVIPLPALFAGQGIQTLHGFLVRQPVKEDQPALADDGCAEPDMPVMRVITNCLPSGAHDASRISQSVPQR